MLVRPGRAFMMQAFAKAALFVLLFPSWSVASSGHEPHRIITDDDGERHLVGLLLHAVRDATVRRQAGTLQATIPSVSRTLTTLPLESTLALGSTVALEASLQPSVSFTLFSENELSGEAEAAEFMAQVRSW